MRRIMLAMSPERAKLALEGRLKDEIRKTFPKCELPCEVFIYVTKGEDILIAYEDYDYDSMSYYSPEYALIPKTLFAKKPSKDDEDYSLYESERDAYRYYKNDFDKTQHDHEWKLNGKVVAKFTLNKVGEIHNFPYGYEMFVSNADIRREGEICQKACLTSDELREYLPCDKERYGYAWHIDNLVIFDEPKELKDFVGFGTPTYEQTRSLVELSGKPYSKETYREHCERFGYTLKRPPQSWQYVEEI